MVYINKDQFSFSNEWRFKLHYTERANDWPTTYPNIQYGHYVAAFKDANDCFAGVRFDISF